MTHREAPPPTLPVGDLLSEGPPDLALRLLAGTSGLARLITSPRVQRPGLALAGQPEMLGAGTVQAMGRSEVAYLAQIPAGQRQTLVDRVASAPVACFILTHGLEASPDLVTALEAHGIPLLATRRSTGRLIDTLGRSLEERLAPSVTLHGTLLDIYGVGVLILGQSGIGKSESALELVLRGHRLVSDDTVCIRKIDAILNGTGPDLSRYHMEVRGLGIINIKDLYGVAAVRERKDIELIVQLTPWEERKDYDRLGLEDKGHTILGLQRPFIEMPVGPGRNLSVLLEVAARHHLLKARGFHAAKELAGRIHEALGKKR